MPNVSLTARWVDAVKPGTIAQTDYFDSRTKGFGLRVSRAGRKTWFCMYRAGGRLRRYTLGTYPNVSLADARAKAKASLHTAAQGGDPAADKKTDRLAETVSELAASYLDKYAKPRKRSWRDDERLIRKELLPLWGTRKAKDIKRRDVIALLDRIAARGAPIQANRVLALIRKMYNWAISRDLIEVNPCLQVKAPAREQQRQRVLDETELRALWQAFDALEPLIGSLFKLRLLTAQRGGEIASMRWQDMDLANGWWTIPPHIAKNGLAHRVPLSAPAAAILKSLHAITGGSEWVFPSPKRRNQYLKNTQKAVAWIRTTTGIDFVPHDLRRTAASYMTAMGISRLTVGKILNHVESGVTSVYDRHSYDDEKRQALDAWRRRLSEIVEGNTINVIPLHGSASH
jgi:integrase